MEEHMKKLRYLLLLGLCLAFSQMSVQAEENPFTVRNNSDGTVAITGYQGTASNVSIPAQISGKTVTMIDASAFAGSDTLTALTVNGSHVEIAASAFAGCGALSSVSVTASELVIGERAFNGCPALAQCQWKADTIAIGAYAFMDDAGLTTASFNGRVTELGAGAFYQCASLFDLTVSGGITSISRYAFRGCSSLVTMNLKKTKSIGAYAFMDCGQLNAVTTGKQLKKIGANAFSGCGSLVLSVDKRSKAERYAKKQGIQYVYSDKTLKEGTNVTFQGGNYTITKSDSRKGEATLLGLSDANKEAVRFDIPDTIKVDGISYKVTAVQDYAFFCNKRLRQVKIGANVRQIGYGSFAYCAKLTRVNVCTKQLKTVESDAFAGHCAAMKVTYPKGKANTYRKWFS
jgi:hypothetical protein